MSFKCNGHSDCTEGFRCINNICTKPTVITDASIEASMVDVETGDTEYPDTGTPDTSEPDSWVPDTNMSDSNLPDTSMPDASLQDTNLPDTSDLDAGSPDTNLSDISMPDTAEPDTNLPDTSMPDTNLPDTNMPDTTDLCDGVDCNGNGICSGGICTCDQGYAGDSCDECAYAYGYYPDCQALTPTVGISIGCSSPCNKNSTYPVTITFTNAETFTAWTDCVGGCGGNPSASGYASPSSGDLPLAVTDEATVYTIDWTVGSPPPNDIRLHVSVTGPGDTIEDNKSIALSN